MCRLPVTPNINFRNLIHRPTMITYQRISCMTPDWGCYGENRTHLKLCCVYIKYQYIISQPMYLNNCRKRLIFLIINIYLDPLIVPAILIKKPSTHPRALALIVCSLILYIKSRSSSSASSISTHSSWPI